MPGRSPIGIGAITNRFPNLNIRRGSQASNNGSTRQPRTPRPSTSGVPDEKELLKVEILVRDPVLWAEFKRRLAEANYFSNAGVRYILPEFLEVLDIPGLDPDYDNVCVQAVNPNGLGNGNNSFSSINSNQRAFRLLQALRTMTLDPPTPNVTYENSPHSLFRARTCPASPGSQMNLSPTKTPLTPMSASTASTATSMTPDSTVPAQKSSLTRGPVPDFLEQPNF